jgi:RNA polymerase sigma factor (sigma-70 family)
VVQRPPVTRGRVPELEIERLYREQRDRLWRAVLAFSGDRDLAADAVAEAFAQLLRRGEAVRDPLRWVWRATFRIAAGELKERRMMSGSEVPETAYEMAEPIRELVTALARLSPKQRAAVILHHYAGYPTKEVAEIIGSTTAAVRVHLSAGRRRLRGFLAAGEGDA